MRRISVALLTTASLVALGSAASGADLAGGYKAPPPPPRPACAWFGGFYAGANVGSATYDWTWSDRDAWAKNEFSANLPSSVSSNKSGFIGGLQGGYNWQRNCTVWGIETDWSWADIRRTKDITDGDVGAALDTLSVSSRLQWLGTTRTRAGVVVDDLLLYVTGGVAYGRFNRTFTANDIGGGNLETFNVSDTRWGWTAGVGTEWALTQNISVKSEALYVRFTEGTSTLFSAVAAANGNNATKRFDYQDSVWIARIGVNYRWGGGPVYAKY